MSDKRCETCKCWSLWATLEPWTGRGKIGVCDGALEYEPGRGQFRLPALMPAEYEHCEFHNPKEPTND